LTIDYTDGASLLLGDESTGHSPGHSSPAATLARHYPHRGNDARAQANKYNAYGRAFPLTGE
jgi:hypothetical protein